jgi:hypothetical protein
LLNEEKENVTLDTGVYGAKVQSWRKSNPREMLKGIIDEIGSNKKAVFAALCERLNIVTDEDSHLVVIVEYWFANNYHSLIAPPVSDMAAARVAKAERIKQGAEALKARAVRMVLMDMVLDNGKTLGKCTKKDLANTQGWLGRVAAKLKPGQMVESVWSESALHKARKG